MEVQIYCAKTLRFVALDHMNPGVKVLFRWRPSAVAVLREGELAAVKEVSLSAILVAEHKGKKFRLEVLGGQRSSPGLEVWEFMCKKEKNARRLAEAVQSALAKVTHLPDAPVTTPRSQLPQPHFNPFESPEHVAEPNPATASTYSPSRPQPTTAASYNPFSQSPYPSPYPITAAAALSPPQRSPPPKHEPFRRPR